MTINILSQSSVDSLRMSAKRGAPILTFAYDELVEEFRLQELPLYVDFDSSVELLMPDGKKQETNNDDVNCLLISKALPSLADIDATDERLWVTLSLREYKEYSLTRWPIEGKEDQNTVNHWFAGSTRGLMRDHAVSRLWWYHRLCSRIEGRPVEETLKLLFFESDYRSSMLERNTTSAITEVVGTIIEITDEFKKKGIDYKRDNFRSFMKNLDLLAGRSRLAVLNKKQLKSKLTDLYLAAYD